MLLELNVKDIALIKRANVEFGAGLNILTGETGAGKSIIIGSIGLALGRKAQSEIIREGAEYAYVELIFDVSDERLRQSLALLSVEPLEDGTVLISRKIGRSRSSSRINDETVTLSRLREVTELLIDIYGQHEHQSLLNPEKHLELLDAFGHEALAPLLSEVRTAQKAYKASCEEGKRFQMKEEDRLREIDFAEFELHEIDEAAIRDGEEEELSARYRRMSHAKVIAEHLAKAYDALSESGVGTALSELEEANGYDESLSGIRDQLFDADSIVSGAAQDIRRYLDSMDMDEADFAEVEGRLDLIRGVMAKYGNSAEAVGAYREKKAARLLELRNYEESRRKNEEEKACLYTALKKACAKLTEARKAAAEVFAKAVCRELSDLGFTSVTFFLAFQEKEPAQDGADEVCFMAALNPGEKPRPLQEVASGGELSRVMLAVKTVLAETDRIPTLIFDEIDTGISGRTAQKVAEKLDVIAGRHQVICITHLPQIAAMADTHFVIAKSEEDGRNVTAIERLGEKESLSELARLLGGAEITDAVMQNAEEMRRLASERKHSRCGEMKRGML